MARDILRTQLTFTWDEVPCGSRRGSVNEYIFYINSYDEITQDAAQTRHHTFHNLSPGTKYIFHIAASNTYAGRGVSGMFNSWTQPGKRFYSNFKSRIVHN